MTEQAVVKRKYTKKKHHQTKQGEWSSEEHDKLLNIIKKIGLGRWSQTSKLLGSRSAGQCQIHYYKYKMSHGLTDQQFLQQIGCPLNMIEKKMSKKQLVKDKKQQQRQSPTYDIAFTIDTELHDFTPEIPIYNFID